MSELNKQTEQPDLASASSSGIARRRMILASLGKGATVAAAVAVPMKSLAALPTVTHPDSLFPGRRCTISGTMSAVHSKETVTTVCEGGSPNYYSDVNNWPSNLTFNPDTAFNVVFGFGSIEASRSMIDILTNSKDSVEASWIAAVLNGAPGSYGANNYFPFTAAQVIGFYKDGGDTATNALAFFRNYMETYGKSETVASRMLKLDKSAKSRSDTFFESSK